MPVMLVTSHAIDRYVERVDHQKSKAEARRYLNALTHRATRLKERTKDGREQWVVDDVVFICKRKSNQVLIVLTIARYENDHEDQRTIFDLEVEADRLAGQILLAEQDLAVLTEKIASSGKQVRDSLVLRWKESHAKRTANLQKMRDDLRALDLRIRRLDGLESMRMLEP